LSTGARSNLICLRPACRRSGIPSELGRSSSHGNGTGLPLTENQAGRRAEHQLAPVHWSKNAGRWFGGCWPGLHIARAVLRSSQVRGSSAAGPNGVRPMGERHSSLQMSAGTQCVGSLSADIGPNGSGPRCLLLVIVSPGSVGAKDLSHFAQKQFCRRANGSPFQIYLSLSAGERVDRGRRFHQPARAR
jgi:hypothetical protein